jgi:hypothetical protein
MANKNAKNDSNGNVQLKRVLEKLSDENKIKSETVKVVLIGTADIMFDRYLGKMGNKEASKIPPEQKLYLGSDGETLLFPCLNLLSLLTASNSDSAPKRFFSTKTYKRTAAAILSNLNIRPVDTSFGNNVIPFVRESAPIKFNKFDGDRDKTSGVYIAKHVARVKGGIPNDKVRPVLPTPWSLEVELSLDNNDEVTMQEILNILQSAGKSIGIGTFRGVYGKFNVAAE